MLLFRNAVSALEEVMATCQLAQTGVEESFRASLGETSKLSSEIRNVSFRLEAYSETVGSLQKELKLLNKYERIPAAYGATLQEVARRINYNRSVKAEIDDLAARLEALRADEVPKRVPVFVSS